VAAALAVAGIAGYFGWSFVSRNSPEIISYAQGKDSSDQEDLVGRASVIDGDTIEIHGKRIRFNGNRRARVVSNLYQTGTARHTYAAQRPPRRWTNF